jgi:dethiobiotin synthetase
MLRGLFITATDTAAGKTVTAAALMHRYRAAVPLRYWKPIQTGIEEDDDTAAVRELGGCADKEIFDQGVRLPRPVSPHLAARLSGKEIAVNSVTDIIAGEPPQTRWIVEGAGGILVPLNSKEKMIDLMARLGLPAVVVARSSLGTINHTLLTLEALHSRALVVAGVVMVGELSPQNRAAIEEFGNVPVLAEMPRFAVLTSAALGQWSREHFDREGRLAEFLNV